MTIEEKTYFGNADDFMSVHHLTVRGSNFEIGEELGRQAIERYGRSLNAFQANPLFAQTRREYFQRNYPIHWERVRGVAAAFGTDPEDDRYDLTGLPYGTDIPMPPGCSVVYYPPSSAEDGNGHLSRNYDFPIGSIADMMQIPLTPEQKARLRPIMSEPYVMEWYPEDDGYDSLAIHSFDTLSGTLDGINSEGLVVSILGEDDVIAIYGRNMEQHTGTHQAVGLHELQVMRFLLDTCATAEEARKALLGVKQYYRFAPCHYIIADITGDSFAYENSIGRNVQHIMNGSGKPQLITNFQLYRNQDPEKQELESLTFDNNAFWRYRELKKRLDEHKGPFTLDEIKANNACVNLRKLIEKIHSDSTQSSVAANVHARTLWYSLYDQTARSVEFRFYLGETKNSDGTATERHSNEISFKLNRD